MKPSQVLMALVIIAIIIFSGFYIWESNDDEDSKDPSLEMNRVEYDYNYYYANSFTSSTGEIYEPGLGCYYVIVKIKVNNVSFDKFITTNTAWKWDVIHTKSGGSMGISRDTFVHPDYKAPILLPGESANLIRVFEVPVERSFYDLEFKNSYKSDHEYPNMFYCPHLL